MMNSDPYVIGARILGALLTVIVLFGGGFLWGHHVGAEDVAALRAQYAQQVAQANADAEKKYAIAAQQSLDTEHALQARLSSLETQRQQDKTTYETTLRNLRSRALAGNVRLRATVAARPVPQCAAAPTAAAAGRPRQAETADLMPTTVAAILGIAGRSSQDVRDYNELLSRYNATVAACNGVIP